MSEIAQLSAVHLRDKVTERIRASFVELIPEAQWKALVQEELDAFMSKQENYGRLNLRQIVRAELTRLYTAEVQKAMQGPEFQETWNAVTSNQSASEFVKQSLKELAPEMFSAIFSGLIQQVVNHVRSAITANVANGQRL